MGLDAYTVLFESFVTENYIDFGLIDDNNNKNENNSSSNSDGLRQKKQSVNEQLKDNKKFYKLIKDYDSIIYLWQDPCEFDEISHNNVNMHHYNYQNNDRNNNSNSMNSQKKEEFSGILNEKNMDGNDEYTELLDDGSNNNNDTMMDPASDVNVSGRNRISNAK